MEGFWDGFEKKAMERGVRCATGKLHKSPLAVGGAALAAGLGYGAYRGVKALSKKHLEDSEKKAEENKKRKRIGVGEMLHKSAPGIGAMLGGLTAHNTHDKSRAGVIRAGLGMALGAIGGMHVGDVTSKLIKRVAKARKEGLPADYDDVGKYPNG